MNFSLDWQINGCWLLPPEELLLAAEEIHLWRADLNLESSQRQQLAGTLSADEWQRAERFHFERDRHHFIAARGILRAILSRYLALPPEQLQFSYGTRGKPALVHQGSVHQKKDGLLCFNLSHSNGLALYAVGWNCHIGIDLEYQRSMSDLNKLAQRFFSATESAAILALPVEQQRAAFFRCWTAREAYLKATGEGLAGLETVELCLQPGNTVGLARINGDLEAAAAWSLHCLEVASGWLAALAVEGQGWQLKRFEF